MGKVRVCGATCHNAKRPKCKCWCGGVFHGEGGAAARQAFTESFKCDELPTTERTFQELTGQQTLFDDVAAGEKWRQAIAAAVAAREVTA